MRAHFKLSTVFLLILVYLITIQFAQLMITPVVADTEEITYEEDFTTYEGGKATAKITTEHPWIADASNTVVCSMKLNVWPSGVRHLYDIYFHVSAKFGNETVVKTCSMGDIEDINRYHRTSCTFTPTITSDSLETAIYFNYSVREDVILWIDPFTFSRNINAFNITITKADVRAPYINFESPTANDLVRGVVPIRARVYDLESSGISLVEFSSDGSEWYTMSPENDEEYFTFNWNAIPVNEGEREIYVRARDNLGNTRTKSITITVEPPKIGDCIVFYFPYIGVGLLIVLIAISTVLIYRRISRRKS